MMIFAISLPFSVWMRVLIGLGRNAIVVAVQSCIPVLNLVLILMCTLFDASATLLLSTSTAGFLVTNLVCFGIARRDSRVKRSLCQAAASSSAVVVSIVGTAVPMLIISASIPLTFQMDRLVLTHVAKVSDIAVYSVAATVFLPVFSVVQVAGRSLWGDFASNRADPEASLALLRRSLLFSIILGAVGSVSLLLIGPFVASWAVDGSIDVPVGLFLVFGALVLVQSVHNPSGNFLTDAAGLKFQAICMILMAVVSLPLSVFLGFSLGAIGVVLATVLAVLVFAMIPCLARSFLVLRAQINYLVEVRQDA
ncbi:hypothetical protein JWS13_14390 [Rhodococcus pseudokoreensis]|uniref:Membrane protein involved in the export of O-antigen and teichoic acid n=1 Tax=Rhodococcus pseudokoreensis TaxID=2811421 RepID=A0A974W311_9NOCA|nr:hypothetical protein [Rhodococcus pseudokoreensis]QSE89735.1 hypothetical protein JWS13_14390 [Rhodococcus pseudokoreensis]